MNEQILHRGPDDSGVYVAEGVAFAMRRLSIIDISGGQQPKHTSDGVSIVFNGEIYNYVSLRNSLIERGYKFESRSDTEVILKLYHAEGVAGLKKLNGMFAVAIHDARSDEVVLARDQIGIKPLYYCLDGAELYFASEIKAILAALSAKPQIDPQAMWDYLTLRYVPPAGTIWRGIKKLRPGHVIRYSVRTGKHEEVTFWSPDFTPDPYDPSRDYAGEFEQHFLAAVESHIVASDVPVGTFLSGGLDSGAITAASIELGHGDLHTFSISGTDAGEDDELPLARLVSERYGTSHHEIVMSKRQYFDQLDRVAWHFDEPYGDITGTALYLLSHAARNHVKVVMSGEGADELLLGYTKAAEVAKVAAIEQWYGRFPAVLLKCASKFFSGRRKSVLECIGNEGPGAYAKGTARHISTTLTDEEKYGIWQREAMTPTRELITSWYTLPTSLHQFAQVQQADFQSWLVEDLLMKADKMAMAASLETRVPFLHLPLVEWCQKAPLQARIGRFDMSEFRTKAVLRDFVARRLPQQVLQAPKRGFSLPVLRWLQEHLKEHRGIAPKSRSLHEWINTEALTNLLADGVNGKRAALEKLWAILMLDRWLLAYAD